MHIMSSIYIIFLVCAILFNAMANILIKVGMVNQDALFQNGAVSAIFTILTNPFAITGIISFGLAFVLYSGVLSKLDLSVAYPIMTGSGFLLVLLASIFLFHEQVNAFRLVGIIAIVFGITVISLKG